MNWGIIGVGVLASLGCWLFGYGPAFFRIFVIKHTGKWSRGAYLPPYRGMQGRVVCNWRGCHAEELALTGVCEYHIQLHKIPERFQKPVGFAFDTHPPELCSWMQPDDQKLALAEPTISPKRLFAEYAALSELGRKNGIDVCVLKCHLPYIEKQLDKAGIAYTRIMDGGYDPQCLSLASSPEHLRIREQLR